MPETLVKDKVKKQIVLAGRLGPHAGKWVAVRGETVLASDETFAGLRRKVAGRKIDRAFRVPRKGARFLL